MRSGVWRFTAAWLASGIAVAVLAGCSSGDEGTTAQPMPADAESAGAAPAQRDDSADSQAGRQQGQGSDRAVSETQLEDSGRKLARSARLELEVPDVDEAAAEARSVAQRAGGYTGSERSDARSATLTLTVPGEALEPALDELEELGKRQRREVSVEDVTDTVVDVESRIASQRKSAQRARALFDRAESIEDITRVEAELAQRESELESLLARQKSLEGKTRTAPITLMLSKAKANGGTGDDGDAGFLAGLAGGWGAFTATVAVVAQGFGAALPFLIAVGVPVALAWWLARRRNREPRPPAAAEAGS